MLATATSTGLVHFHTLSFSSPDLARLLHHSTHQLTQSTADLCLYLAWHPLRPDLLGATFNDGSARIYRVSIPDDDHIFHLATLPSHALETWTLSFAPPSSSPSNPTSTTTVYTGGDDALLLVSSLPPPPSPNPEILTTDEPPAPTILPTRLKDRRSHQAGLTAILPLPRSPTTPARELVLTGSYDDHLRLLSLPPAGGGGGGRVGGRVHVLAKIDLGGGVWRLKFLSSKPTAEEEAEENEEEGTGKEAVILASCMHAGTRIVRLRRRVQEDGDEAGEWGFEVLATFEEHASMNYGSDVQPSVADGVGGRRAKKIVSTSFYDRLLCVWEVEV